MGICDAAVGNGSALDGLPEQSIEEQSTRAGAAAVEAKHELIK
jgi:hypothetical protein